MKRVLTIITENKEEKLNTYIFNTRNLLNENTKEKYLYIKCPDGNIHYEKLAVEEDIEEKAVKFIKDKFTDEKILQIKGF